MAWEVQHLAEADVVQVTAEGLHDRRMLRELTRRHGARAADSPLIKDRAFANKLSEGGGLGLSGMLAQQLTPRASLGGHSSEM